MKITITQRIGAGFSLLVLLMLLMSFSSYRGLNQLNGQMIRAGEEVAPMLVSSGAMGVSLLAANKTLMQSLFASDVEQIASHQQAFAQQQSEYQQRYQRLQKLASASVDLSRMLTESNSRAQQFLSDSARVFSTHQQFVEREPARYLSFQRLEKLIAGYKTELDDLVAYGDDHHEMSAATMLAAQLMALADAFAQVRQVSSPQKLDTLTASIRKALEAMYARSEKLAVSSAETAGDLRAHLVAIERQLESESGVLTLVSGQLDLNRQKDELLLSQAALINSATISINRLVSSVEQQARREQVVAGEVAAHGQIANIAIGLVSVLLAAITGFSVCRSIRRPLHEMMDMLRLMADGDFSQRIRIVSRDEFADLSVWVNQLADRLVSTISEISNGSWQVTRTTRDSAEVSEKTRVSMARQSEQTAIVVSSMNAMVSCVSEVAESAERAQQAVIAIDASADRNRLAMDENIKMIQRLAGKIENASRVINRLNERSDSIGHILDVIGDVAEQTNLLALNAAIEAARAGDQGRGFAVVADEVRTLASRTQNSTAEIQVIIEQLQSGATEAVAIMESSSGEARRSVESIEAAGGDFGAMLGQLADIRSMSEQIATAAEQQSNSCCEISDSVRRIAGMSETCSRDAARIVDESGQMVELAKHQQMLVGRFKLG